MIFKATLAASVALISGALAAQELPRRGSLGVELAPSPDGLTVRSVLSPAAKAVLEPGDIILAINGVATPSTSSLQEATHKLPNGEAVPVKIRRDGVEQDLELVTTPRPMPSVEGAAITYGTATAPSGLRVRTVTVVPEESALGGDKGLPAVFMIQGITCRSIDGIGGESNAYGAMARRLVAAGFVVSFADKPGVGDSDGPACNRGGFDAELEGYTAAGKALAALPMVDKARVYGIGISMGGIQVPLVAREVDLAGIITWGTVVQPWGDYMITNFPMRSMLDTQASITEDAIELSDLRKIMARALILEQSPEQIEREDPETYARYIQEFGALDGFGGRSLAFHREVDNAPTPQAWEDYDGALLAMHGEYDWVGTMADHRLATALVTKDGEGSAQFEVVPGVDHGWTAHDTLDASFRAPFGGRPDRQFHERAVNWLTKIASEAR